MASTRYMDIGKYLSESWNLTIKNVVAMVVADIIATVLGVVTIGILSVPLSMGVAGMYLAGKKGARPEIPDVFKYLSRTLPMLGAAILYCVAVVAGLILLVVPGLIFAAWWMYAVPLVAFKGMTVMGAMKKSKEVVRANGTWMHVLFLVIIAVVSSAGSMVFYVGTFFTAPIAIGALVLAYAEECD
jgi:membrane-anchored glycerophosphoryl diester phosphodiesterase (GDPDase)